MRAQGAEGERRAVDLLLQNDVEPIVVLTAAAVLFGDCEADDAEVAQAAVQLAWNTAGLFPFRVVRFDFLDQKIADHRPEVVLLDGEHAATHCQLLGVGVRGQGAAAPKVSINGRPAG